MVKREAFISNLNLNFDLELNVDNGVVILSSESFVYSSIWNYSYKNKFYKKKPLSMLMLLLISGDIHPCPGPDTVQHIKDICNKKGLKFFSQNIRGLHGKYDEIREILVSCKKIDIFSLTEIFVNDQTTTNFTIPGYDFIKRSRKNGIGGGVGMYIRNGINFTVRNDLKDDDIEAVWIEIFPKSAKSFIFCIIYKPPESSKHLSKDFATKLSQKIETITNERKETIIMGDLNSNYLDNNNQK